MNKSEKICYCFNVTVGDIEKAIENGADSVDSVKSNTRAGKGCGRCTVKVEELASKLLKENN